MKLQIEKCIYGGSGLARDGGKTIFVPYTLPGEEVEAHASEDKGSFAKAELDAVLRPSNQRTHPPCEYFGQCGGCHYQHAGYPYQIELKRTILEETLQRARLRDLPEILSIFAEPLGYRNRVRLHFQAHPFAIGYKQRASNKILRVRHCPIAAPVLDNAIAAVAQFGERLRLGEDFSEIEFFTNESGSEVLLSLWARKKLHDAAARLRNICETLRTLLPALSGANLLLADKHGVDRRLSAWGEPSLTYRAAGRDYRVSNGSFFQINRFLIDRLVELVQHEGSSSAWDLYAGVGLFSKALAEHFEQVTAVEVAPSSISDLHLNLPSTAHRKVASATLPFLRQQANKPTAPKPHLVVVDPPRAGLGNEVTALLTKVRAQKMIYISCDPATLSRDLHALVESGYRLTTLHMVDLFPQTFHLESVTTLTLD